MADLSPGLGMISTRTSRSSMSSSINPLPLTRRTSDSSTPSTPSTSSSIPSFRAIRNLLLPFGNNKPASPTQALSPHHKQNTHFTLPLSVAPVITSLLFLLSAIINVIRTNPPVIFISRLDAEEFGAHKRSYDLVRVASASDSLLPSLSTVSQSLDDEMYG